MQEQRDLFRDIVREALNENGPPEPPSSGETTALVREDNSADADVEQQVQTEIEAYHRLHPALWEKYPGQHVAILGQEMIDHDKDFTALYERVDEAYPDKFALLRQVEKEPEREIRMRSPRLVSTAV